jgi:hypothetical protein
MGFEKEIKPLEREAQWWLSFWLLIIPWENLQVTASLSKKIMSDYNSTKLSMYIIGLFLSTGAGWACGIPSVFTQIYLCFSAAEDFFSAMLD